MKKLFLFGALLVFAGAVSAASAPGLIARIHFVGVDKIAADTNALSFTNFFASAEAQALKAQTLEKLSHAPARWWQGKIADGAADGAAQLRPLFEDLLQTEWFLDARPAADGSPEFALAIRLDNSRAQLWQNNLATVLAAWTKSSVQNIAGGWQLSSKLTAKPIRLIRAGDWTVLSCEADGFTLGNGVVAKVSPAAAKTYWLSLDADWPQLVRVFPALKLVDLPQAKMNVIGRGGDLHLDGKIISPQPFTFTLEKWRLPTNSIHQPFISFTAARGIAPWLKKQSWAQPLLLAPVPNQVFFWAMQGISFQTFAAAPVPDANTALVQLHKNLSTPAAVSAQSEMFLPLTMVMTNREITWRGMPFAAPFVKVLREASGDFLLGGLFPKPPRGKALPPELFTRLAPANLVYYHWEITDPRLKMLLQPAQLTLMMTRRQQLGAEVVATKWLNQVGPTLGNTTTEITQTAPNELTFKRKAPGGLTAIELFALASWLEAKNFPGCDLRLPPRKKRAPQSPAMNLFNAPAAPATK